MKHTLLFLSVLYFCIGCNNQYPNHQITVTEYYSAFDTGDFSKIKSLVSDSITIVSGDFTTPYTKESFYTFFKWDSVFQTNYKLINLKNQDEQVVATVTMSSIRNEFLKNSSMSCGYEISFDAGKISKLKELDCPGADWNAWQMERDALVAWIKVKHPELDGFINDMTMEGAKKYLEAIEFYKNRKVPNE